MTPPCIIQGGVSDFTEDYLNAAAGGPLTEVCGETFARFSLGALQF